MKLFVYDVAPHKSGGLSYGREANNVDQFLELGEVRRRAAFLPCCIKSNPDVSAGGRFDRAVIDRFSKQAGAGMKPCVVVPDQCCRSGIKGALRRNGGDGELMSGGIRPLHLHLAVVNSVAAAAGWQVRV